jgi:NAD(P)-dependent dehydrogenase (short-subunit alcohol dehydrogenase family)
MPAKSVAIVTGASQGIGCVTAIRLARDFESVVLAARQEDELKKTAAAVESAGAEALLYTFDLREPCPVMTGRRRSFMDKWAPAHGMSVEKALNEFPEKVGIVRYGEPEEIAGLMAYMVSKEARWLTGASIRMDGGEIKGI